MQPTAAARRNAPRRRLPAWPAAIGIAVALGGCGSTVPSTSASGTGAPQPAVASDGLLVPTSAPVPGSPAVAGPPSNAGAPGAYPAAPAGGPPPSGNALPPGVVARPGAPVKVGFVVSTGSFDAAAKAAGIGALQTGNQQQQVQVVVNDINATGGLAGHRIQPVFNTPDASAGSPDQADSETCAAFTQDTHVAFAISTLAHTEVLHSCLAKAGVPLLDDGLYLYDSKVVVPGYLYLPSGWLLDRLMRNQIDALARTGFLNDPGKVGVLLYDLPIPRRVLQDTVLPRLAHYGKTQVDVATSPFTTAGYANQQANVLKFNSDHVTRVLEIAFLPVGFMASAESQDYHPRYAVDSSVGPDTIRASAPADQLTGMVGVGWIPSSDTGSAIPVTAAGQHCLTLMRKSGQDTSNSATASLMQEFCDAGWFLQAATGAARDATAQGLLRGARLTNGYVSASSFASDMTTGRPDGLSGFRDLAYESGCSCIRYTGPTRPAA